MVLAVVSQHGQLLHQALRHDLAQHGAAAVYVSPLGPNQQVVIFVVESQTGELMVGR